MIYNRNLQMTTNEKVRAVHHTLIICQLDSEIKCIFGHERTPWRFYAKASRQIIVRFAANPT